MTDAITRMEARVARLEDIEAIRRLKARYLRACDLKRVDEVRDCFLPGPVRVDYQGFPLFEDRDAFVETYRQMACQGGVYDLHHASNAEIDLTGPGTARGLWSLDFRSIHVATRLITHLAVEYEDIYRRHDGRWWIAETKSRITSSLVEEVGEDGVPHYASWNEAGSLPDQV